MPPKRARKVESEDESGAEETTPVEKKSRSKPKPKPKNEAVPSFGKQINEDGDTYFEIGGRRRVTIRSFNGMKLVDIREMYVDRASGELKPGKKGISLSEEQYMGLVNVHGTITEALNELDVGSGSASKKFTKPTKAKVTSSKSASKKKARKEEEEEEEEEEEAKETDEE